MGEREGRETGVLGTVDGLEGVEDEEPMREREEAWREEELRKEEK